MWIRLRNILFVGSGAAGLLAYWIDMFAKLTVNGDFGQFWEHADGANPPAYSSSANFPQADAL